MTPSIERAQTMEDSAWAALDPDSFDVAGDAWEEVARRAQASRMRSNAALARLLVVHGLLDVQNFLRGERVRHFTHEVLQARPEVRMTRFGLHAWRVRRLQAKIESHAQLNVAYAAFLPLASDFIDGRAEAAHRRETTEPSV